MYILDHNRRTRHTAYDFGRHNEDFYIAFVSMTRKVAFDNRFAYEWEIYSAPTYIMNRTDMPKGRKFWTPRKEHDVLGERSKKMV